MSQYVLSLDQGQPAQEPCSLMKNKISSLWLSVSSRKFTGRGWVEHSPDEIYTSQHDIMLEVIEKSGIHPRDIAAIGIANQRETTILWNRHTGKPIYNAIVWQCRRTAPICEELKARNLEGYIKDTTGLVLDAYFSATKIKWILDRVEGARELAKKGDILFGTVDTWLIWKLSGGKVHVTDYTNASRTMLYNIHTLEWDRTLLEALDIPAEILPEVRPSSSVYGYADIEGVRSAIAGAGGPAGSSIRTELLLSWGHKKHIRNRLLPSYEYRYKGCGQRERTSNNDSCLCRR